MMHMRELTPRQRQVAELVALGYTNAQVAAALEVSPNTVKKHLKDIFALLEVANRTEMAAVLSLPT
jgi:DNA-binding NarL/FixJ family response regulator